MKITSLIFLLILSCNLFSQNTIQFTNPSFEDKTQAGKAPRAWYNCGHPDESPPDILPTDAFQVDKSPNHGDSYLGLVTRDNETWEAVGQRLRKPLLADSTYAFGIHLARSQYYVSQSRSTGDQVNYTTAICLKIYGGNDYCDKKELLYNSDRINNARWKLYNIEFTPKEDYDYILFEAYYVTPVLFAYNGNLLLDNIVSNITAPNAEVFTETEEEATNLEKDLWAMEEMLEFFRYSKEERVFDYFDHYPIRDIEILANSFRKFDLNESADTLEDLIMDWKITFTGKDSSEENIVAFAESCKNIDDILIADKFDEKIDAFIEKNKEELKLLIDE